MKIFISDLHIGSPLFKMEKEIVDLFNDTEVKEIYILGDLLDTWEESPYKTAEKKKDFIYELNQCGKIKVILRGNHDPETSVMKEIFTNAVIMDRHIMTLFGKKAVLVHGDEFDNSVAWTRYLFFTHYLAERVGINMKGFFRNSYHKFLLFKNDLPKNSLVLNAEKLLIEKYSENFSLIICGHTHLAKLVRSGSMDYVNCGCVIYRPNYVVADKNTIILKRF